MLIAHINKRFDKDKEIDVDDVSGNKAVSDLSRSVFLLTSEKDNPTDKVLIHVKSNWAPRQPRIFFSLEDTIEDFREDAPVGEASTNQANFNEIALALAQEGKKKKLIRIELRKAGAKEMELTRALYYTQQFGFKM